MANIGDNLKALAVNRMKALDVFHPHVATKLDAQMVELKRAHPDFAWQIDHSVEQGNRVAFRYTAGSAAAKMQWQGSAVAIVENGKIVAVRLQDDWARLIMQGQIPKVPQDDMGGHWHGEAFGVGFNLDVSEEGQKVSGTLSVLNQNISVNGTNDGHNVHLSGNSPMGGQTTFAGTWVGPNKINGTLSGVPGTVSLSRG